MRRAVKTAEKELIFYVGEASGQSGRLELKNFAAGQFKTHYRLRSPFAKDSEALARLLVKLEKASKCTLH